MKKARQIIALIGALLLTLMYAATLFFALIDHTATMAFFKASIACTLIIPVLLYGILLFTRLSWKNSDTDNNDTDAQE